MINGYVDHFERVLGTTVFKCTVFAISSKHNLSNALRIREARRRDGGPVCPTSATARPEACRRIPKSRPTLGPTVGSVECHHHAHPATDRPLRQEFSCLTKPATGGARQTVCAL